MKICGKALQKEKKAIWKVSIVICVKIQRGYTGTFVDYMPSMCLHAVILFICLFFETENGRFLMWLPLSDIAFNTERAISFFSHFIAYTIFYMQFFLCHLP